SDSPITYTPYDQAYEPGFEDMYRRVPSVDKLASLTGFRPSVPLTEIVDHVIQFFREKSKPGLQRAVAAAKENPVQVATGTSAD
ncbi:MAG: hypothetical protein WA660_10620, partial [Candidatus Acidiferrales bacterium]